MPTIEELGMQAASQVTSGILGIVAGKQQDKRQYKMAEKMQALQIQGNKELTDYNAAKQLQMWKDTSYGAQKEQMQLAGLNPALMYGMGGGGGQSNSVATGSVAHGGGPSTGGELQAVMGMGMQLQLLKAQKENIEADTELKKANASTSNVQTEVLKVTNELQKIDLTVNKETVWSRINEIASKAIEQQEKGIQAGIQTEIQRETVNDNITRIKAEAINVGIQKSVMESGIEVNKAAISKMAADIAQRGQEIDIKTFEAEFKANFPGVGNVTGNLLQQMTEEINKIMKKTTGITPNTKPQRVN